MNTIILENLEIPADTEFIYMGIRGFYESESNQSALMTEKEVEFLLENGWQTMYIDCPEMDFTSTERKRDLGLEVSENDGKHHYITTSKTHKSYKYYLVRSAEVERKESKLLTLLSAMPELAEEINFGLESSKAIERIVNFVVKSSKPKELKAYLLKAISQANQNTLAAVFRLWISKNNELFKMIYTEMNLLGLDLSQLSHKKHCLDFLGDIMCKLEGLVESDSEENPFSRGVTFRKY